VIGVFVASLGLFPKIGMDFIPKEDKSEFEVKIKADAGLSLEEMVRRSKKVESILRADKRVLYTTLSVGYNPAQEKNKALSQRSANTKGQGRVYPIRSYLNQTLLRSLKRLRKN